MNRLIHEISGEICKKRNMWGLICKTMHKNTKNVRNLGLHPKKIIEIKIYMFESLFARIAKKCKNVRNLGLFANNIEEVGKTKNSFRGFICKI